MDLAAGFDALYVHVGGSQAGLDRIEELGLDNFEDGIRIRISLIGIRSVWASMPMSTPCM